VACLLIFNFVRLFLIVFLFYQTFLNVLAEEKLFEKNQWRAVLIISDNPKIGEWYAARSLSDWAEVVTGKKINLLSESENPPTGLWKIYIGKTQAASQNQVKPAWRRGDSAIREIKDKSIYLIGNNPGATRIAVGRFCEQVLGITFCQPGTNGADYTQLKEVPIPGKDIFQPAFYWRSVGGLTNEISKDWAYAVGYGDRPSFSHNFYKIFTENEWKQDPSFFAESERGYLKPTGLGNDANPNLNHPQAVTVARHYAENWFKNNPDSTSVPMGLNDTITFDKKVESEGWFRDRPVRTNYLIGFLNKVTEGSWLNKNNDREQQRVIGTLAYLDTLRAPTIKVNPDIFPWVCVDRMGYTNEEFAQEDRDNCLAWVKSGADNVGAYDYWYGNNFCTPRINFSAQDKSIKKVYGAGVTGWYAELYPIWAFDAPKAWLGTKLLENPAADANVLLKQWFDSAYGPASNSMHNIFRVIENEWIQGGKNQWLYGLFEESTAEFLSNKAVNEIEQALALAEKELNILKKPSQREKNYLWRLNQFKETWNLVKKFREVVQLRKAQPTTLEETLSALKNLIKAEQLFEEAQDQYNFKWSTTSQKINWSRLPATNPREDWTNRIKLKPELNRQLLQCVQEDITGNSRLYWLWDNKKSEIKTIDSVTDVEIFRKKWTLESNLRKNSETINQSTSKGLRQSLLAVKNQSGLINYTQKINPRCLIKFSINHIPVGGNIKLHIYFKGQGQSLTRSQQVSTEHESLLVVSPSWTEQIEFRIQFENAIDLKSLEITQLNL